MKQFKIFAFITGILISSLGFGAGAGGGADAPDGDDITLSVQNSDGVEVFRLSGIDPEETRASIFVKLHKTSKENPEYADKLLSFVLLEDTNEEDEVSYPSKLSETLPASTLESRTIRLVNRGDFLLKLHRRYSPRFERIRALEGELSFEERAFILEDGAGTVISRGQTSKELRDRLEKELGEIYGFLEEDEEYHIYRKLIERVEKRFKQYNKFFTNLGIFDVFHKEIKSEEEKNALRIFLTLNDERHILKSLGLVSSFSLKALEVQKINDYCPCSDDDDSSWDSDV